MTEKIFDKYETIGPDYHYRQIDKSNWRSYNASVDARFKTLINKVRNFSLGKNLRILDVGCGDGVALYLIHQNNYDLELHGIDPSEKAISIAKKRVPGHFQVGGAYELPYSDEFFDIVISSDVIEHVENPNKMLEEIKRVAKPGSHIILGTPIRRTRDPIDPQHVQEFFTEDFLSLVKSYFADAVLHESHNLILTLLYNAPTKSFWNWKYAINLLAIIFDFNPFTKERTNKSQMFAYQYIVCRK